MYTTSLAQRPHVIFLEDCAIRDGKITEIFWDDQVQSELQNRTPGRLGLYQGGEVSQSGKLFEVFLKN